MRKFTSLALATVCFAVSAKAQITKGSTFLGGSFGVSSSSSEAENNQNQKSEGSGWSLYPQIGKAVGNNKIVGLRFGYSRSKQEDQFVTQTQKQESSGFSGGIFYRRYYPLSNRFYLFGEAGVDFATSKLEQKNNDVLLRETSFKTISFDITPGISYAASSKLHLEASLNRIVSVYYQWANTKTYSQFPPNSQPLTSTQKSFALSGNGNGFSGITIGLRWILPAKTNKS